MRRREEEIKMGGSRKVLLMMGLVTVMVMVGEGQYVPSCSRGLAPCLDYINSMTPPPISCCNPLKYLVANDISCICDLYTNPSILQAFGLNITNALRLTRLCSLNNIPFSQLCNTTYGTYFSFFLLFFL